MLRPSRRAIVRFLAERRQEAFGPVFYGFAAVAAASATACYFVLGAQDFRAAIGQDLRLLVDVLPRILAAVALAGFVRMLLPRDRIASLLGAKSGLRGLVIATLAGMVTPGGPMTAFAFLVALRGSGTDKGAMVAYATGWALLGLQRILVWDLPLMGADFSLLRFGASCTLPIVAGLIARRIPLEPVLPEPRHPARAERPEAD